ncbi:MULTISPECIES: N-acetylglucosamine-6-phosphate deacetylase [Allobacillus]|uniref:N-acetylglucosamine-6-phosphate deacetylase n=1 Tax=Allobacillus salarius TaxID=1955272 RepID=A0A556P6E0_9BACI|nr:N-acetylglucosamine-6-phosphate deacetylase [Allobacillus salarius]TSJ59955.1 N-acetylglucosamine-6-phosphate deacetylase [Allobacillus salarius]
MNQLLIKGGRVVGHEEVYQPGYILVEDEKIKRVGPMEEAPNDENIRVIELTSNQIVFPGFIDIHIHGANGYDVMDGTMEALKEMTSVVPAEGTTSFLATTITESKEATDQALQNVARFVETDYTGAEILGIHLEGPFINEKRAGAQPVKHILRPDLEQFDAWQELSNQLIKVVTMAPEMEGGQEFVKHLSNQGVIASIGHSDAIYEDVKKAEQNGLKHATHLFNGMRGIHHREPGVAGSVFLSDQLKAEVIFDEIHVNPTMVQLAYQNLGAERMMLITDSMRGKCLRNGVYDLGGQEVTLQDGEARLADGTLAGSVLKMNEAVKNAAQLKPMDLMKLAQLSSGNVAKSLGVDHYKGAIREGLDADLVVLTEDFEVKKTFCRGYLTIDK